MTFAKFKGIADGIIANAIWQCGLSALPAALPFAARQKCKVKPNG